MKYRQPSSILLVSNHRALVSFDSPLLRLHTLAPVETDELAEIIDGSIGELREEVRVLRMAVDGLREVLEWITRNPDALFQQPDQVPSVLASPPEPGSDDCHSPLHEVPSEPLQQLEPLAPLPDDTCGHPESQGQLF